MTAMTMVAAVYAYAKTNDLIVTVNDVAITRSYIDRHVNMMAELLKNKNPKVTVKDIARFKAQRLKPISDQCFQRIVIAQGLAPSNITVSVKVRNTIKQECLRAFGKKKQTFDQLHDYIRKAGFNKEFNESLEFDCLTRAFFETVCSNQYFANAADLARTKKRIADYNMRSDATNALTLAIARDVVKKARAGESFTNLVEKYSQDTEREVGGTLGDCDDSDFVSDPKVWQRLVELKAGDVSDVMEIEDGYAIYRIDKLNSAAESTTGAESITLSRIFFRRAYRFPKESDEDLIKEIEGEKRKRLYNDTYWALHKQCKIKRANTDTTKQKGKK